MHECKISEKGTHIRIIKSILMGIMSQKKYRIQKEHELDVVLNSRVQRGVW